RPGRGASDPERLLILRGFLALPRTGLAFLGRRMLDDRDHSRRHELRRTNLVPAARPFGDVDVATHGRDLDAAAVLRRDDLERAHPITDVDEHLYTITTHDPSLGAASVTQP